MKTYNKKCNSCGKEFTSTNIRKIYCSNACNQRENKIRNGITTFEVNCSHCNSVLLRTKINNNYFCNMKCQRSYFKQNNNLEKCKYCGKDFIKQNKNHFFCDGNCKYKYYYKNAELNVYKCEYCNVSFETKIKKHGEHIFCSHECSSNYNSDKNNVIKKCEICEKSFRIRRSLSNQKFCSIECQGVWQSKERCGTNSPTYKHEISIEERTNICKCCGKKTIDSPLRIKAKTYCSLKCKMRSIKKTDTKPHLLIQDLLNKNHIIFENEKQYDRFLLDIYLNDYNLPIEIMGGFWHGDNRIYPELKDKIQFAVIKKDNKKNKIFRDKYKLNVLYLWEYDIMNNIDLCNNLIKYFIENKGNILNYHSFNYSINNNKLKLNKEIIIPYMDINSSDFLEKFNQFATID